MGKRRGKGIRDWFKKLGNLDTYKNIYNKGREIYDKVKPVHDFIKDNKLISRGADAVGYKDLASKAGSYGYGVRRKKSRRGGKLY